MAIELRQQLRLSQQLVMTPQLQQAIKLLQLSRQELVEEVDRELVENPVLEEAAEGEEDGPAESPGEAELSAGQDGSENSELAEAEATPSSETASQDPADRSDASETPESTTDEMVADVDWESYMESRPQTSLGRPDDERPALEDNLTPRPSLTDHLMWQLGFADMPESDKGVATLCIGNLSADGYLEEDLEKIAELGGVDIDTAEKILLRLQRFDPVGVGARTLTECLLVQLEVSEIQDALVWQLAREHLGLLQRKDYASIARLEDRTIEEVARAATTLASLEPRPGRPFAEEDPIYITPDIFVYKIGDEYHVVLNEDGLPKLRVSNAYRQVLQQNDRGEGAKETRAYVREKLRSAVWLIKSIHQRQRTIVKVMESIVRFQREFFDNGIEHLRPLNLRDVAEDIEMHESTVSRVTTAKYVQTPHGLYELKFFFNSSIQTGSGDPIASESVKEKIRTIILGEDTKKPLSDQKIADRLGTQGIQVARRTVTKYRESLRILSSTLRRQIG